ncbi:hypothetical protein L873DRAFT_1801516 [Choiromyces venosus 120613-1]|uniref:Uncharacterized protein n=1 Tax=Choiromyces venosus 120613-1 TaxID=1336337 RepID=A0A3N4K141_9PEZI|nr:hypothetical protein L873DRAFT_1801516 [Choiromyces venosus 120613-1]
MFKFHHFPRHNHAVSSIPCGKKKRYRWCTQERDEKHSKAEDTPRNGDIKNEKVLIVHKEMLLTAMVMAREKW